MSLTRPLAVALLATGLCLAPSIVGAQNQVKPYFLIVFDTSGSMNDRAPMSDPTRLDNSCNFTTTTTSGMTTITAARKMDAAKCALGKLLNSTGDADFGLMQFAQSASCGNGASCGPTASSAQLRVPIETNTSGGILSLIDEVGASNSSNANDLCAGGYTPLGGTLVASKDYFEGNLNYEGGGGADPAPTAGDTALSCRPLSVILLTDGVECCNACDNTMSLFNAGCPGPAADIAAAGLEFDDGEACPAGDSACDSWGGCGDDDGFESAPQKAWELRTMSMVPSASGAVSKPIRTYVVGFGLTPGDERLERIAIGGGTDNPASPNYAFYAQNEAELALAFSQIIADSQPPVEECNDLDDDCDTLIDEGFPKYCDLSMGVSDRIFCDEPDETLCDGIDDDCDGIIDEGTMNECGACGDATPAEVCDNFDNDCDGTIDEGTGGGACGRDEGECKAGELVCRDGVLECEGAIGPSPEQCNGLDDDCDGVIDEGELCPDGRCVAGMCSPFCQDTEFVDQCNNGRRPETQPNGECLCIEDDCDRDACEAMTIERDGEPLCTPDSDEVAECLCRGGACTHPCDNVTCSGEQVCDPRRGLCVIDDCRGLGCDEGSLCDVVERECVEDECEGADCDDDEVCRRGVCEKSCGDIRCGDGERCAAGRCIEDACADMSCGDGLFCDPSTESCEDDPCDRRGCDPGFVCISTSGDCERDPCFGVRCPSGQACRLGECARFDNSGGPVQEGDPSRLLATGGGGCSCSTIGTAPSTPARSGLAGLVALLFAGLALVRLRRRTSPAVPHALLTIAVALSGALASGCSVSPYCVNCIDPNNDGGGGNGGNSGFGGPSGNGGNSGSSGDGGPGGSGGTAGFDPDSGTGGSEGDGCSPVFEECNNMDDDCDLRVDEDVEPLVNNCEQRGICEDSAPSCVGGEFECQYPAEREDDETLCDGLDNDCDGDVDEAFPTLGDDCSLGIGQCATAGKLECNGAGTGVVCVIGEMEEPSDEVCDGVDNDCDGVADEPKSDPGTSESFVRDELVQVAASVWMYKYEASRPDSTEDSQGIIGERACSKAEVMPWTNVTYDEAVTACEAAGLKLCTEAQWVDGCNGQTNNCAWGYAPGGTCAAYPANGANACNGHDVTALPGSPDTDELKATGVLENCFSPQMGGGQIFDLSGNAKEWVTDTDDIGDDLDTNEANPTRGGSYNNLPGGMRCDFAFSAANNDVRLRNIGFRCCTTTAP
jgi:MYXO-CTERM domain-containing protein